MAATMEMQFPYECPRCGAHGELSVDAMSSDEQGDGVEAARRDLQQLRRVLRCPGCGKCPRAGIARAVAHPATPLAVSGALLVAWSFVFGVGRTLDLVLALVLGTAGVVAVVLRQRALVRRAGQVTTIRLAAAIPEARALALPPAIPEPKPGTPS